MAGYPHSLEVFWKGRTCTGSLKIGTIKIYIFENLTHNYASIKFYIHKKLKLVDEKIVEKYVIREYKKYLYL